MILTEPNPLLKKKSKKARKADSKLEIKLLNELPEDALGLAAPQIGSSVQLVAIDGKNPTLIYNLKVKGLGEKEEGIEGCLSIPDKLFLVERFTNVQWSGRDRHWRKVQGTAKGLLARVLQHEADHLRGVLISSKGAPVDSELEVRT